MSKETQSQTFKYKDAIRRVRIVRGKTFYDYIPADDLPLGIVLQGDRQRKIFIDASAVKHFHKQLLNFSAYRENE